MKRLEEYRIRHHKIGITESEEIYDGIKDRQEAYDLYRVVGHKFPLHWRCIEQLTRVTHEADEVEGVPSEPVGVMTWRIIKRSN